MRSDSQNRLHMKPSSISMLTTACALLAGPGCASRVDDAKAQAVAKRLSRGQALIGQADYKQAHTECLAGVEELGSYLPKPPICEADGRSVSLLDHTGEQLIVAGMLQRDGKLADAAQSVCSVLKNRISLAKLRENTCR